MTIFQVFTLVGSVLGIIAFFLNFLTPISNYNKEKWGKLKQVIEPVEFNEYVTAIGQGRLPKDLHDKVITLIYFIRKDSEEIHFKFIFKNIPEKYLRELYETYYQMLDKLQVPYWDRPETPSLRDDYAFMINKEYFNEKAHGITKDYDKLFRENLDYVADKAEEMYQLYRKVSKQLNKLPYEYLRFW